MKTLERWFLTDTKMGASTNTSKATNSAIEAGIRYHRKMYKLLAAHIAMSLPNWGLYIEPWFKSESQKLRSPDAVLRSDDLAIVVEVKKNWQDGRDVKLLDEYLPLVASAFGVKTRPLMIVGNVRGLKHKPLLSLADIIAVPSAWTPGKPTPTLLKL
jgi:predicted nuclease of restriction endonuclease-like RecB superfamily